MARILVVGGAGLLGQHVLREARRRGHEAIGTCRGAAPASLAGPWVPLDLRDGAVLRRTVRDAAPDLVVNAAALTDVDGCEARPEEARAVNAVAPGILAEAAGDAKADFVHASTDYVFDGEGPATEDTEPRPLSAYGRTKREGEVLVRRAYPASLILRLSAVFGWNTLSAKANSVTWILQKVEAGQEVPLFTDQRITPTYAGTAAGATLDLWAAKARGTFHVACRDCLSRLEMGRAVVEAFGIPGARLVPVAMASVSLKAPRPRAPCLVVRRVEETLKRNMPGFRECLEDMRETR